MPVVVQRTERPGGGDRQPDGASNGPVRSLTPRERQVCALIVAGASNKEIAVRLSIAERTVKAHATHIFRKLGLSSRVQLAVRIGQPRS